MFFGEPAHHRMFGSAAGSNEFAWRGTAGLGDAGVRMLVCGFVSCDAVLLCEIGERDSPVVEVVGLCKGRDLNGEWRKET